MKRDEYDKLRKKLKLLTSEHAHAIWEIAKTGDLSELSPESRQLAEIMLEHQDEYFNQFETADVLANYEYDQEFQTNPFLHVAIHAITENQLNARDPIELYQFYNSMRKEQVSHHVTIHLIVMIFFPLLVNLMRDPSFDIYEHYRSLLKRAKTKKPEKIWEWLVKEQTKLIEAYKGGGLNGKNNERR